MWQVRGPPDLGQDAHVCVHPLLCTGLLGTLTWPCLPTLGACTHSPFRNSANRFPVSDTRQPARPALCVTCMPRHLRSVPVPIWSVPCPQGLPSLSRCPVCHSEGTPSCLLSISARGLVSAWCLHWFHSGIGLYLDQPCAQRASVDQCCPGERCAPPCPVWHTSWQAWGAVGLRPAAGAWLSAGPLTLESTQLPTLPSGISRLRPLPA